MAAKSISMSELKAMLKPELGKHAQTLGIDIKGLTKEQLLKAIAEFTSGSVMNLGEEVGLTATTSPVDSIATHSVDVEVNVEIKKMKLQMEHEFKLRQLEVETQRLEKQAALEIEKQERQNAFAEKQAALEMEKQ